MFRGILTNLGSRIYWPDESSINDSANQTKNIVLDNIETHSNLFDLYNVTSDSAIFTDNLKLARVDKTNQLSFIIGLKQNVKAGLSNNVRLTQTETFENAKSYLAVCSYRNQLVSFIVRKSFACMALLGSAQLSNRTSLEVQSEQAFSTYSFLSKLFNKEYIIKVISILFKKKNCATLVDFYQKRYLSPLSDYKIYVFLLYFTKNKFSEMQKYDTSCLRK